MKRAEPGWFVLTLAGFAALLGSFLPFYTYTAGVDVTVWSRGLFPTAALIPLLGFVIGLQALFVLVVGHEPRSPFLNFTWQQVRLAAGAFMILLALSYLLQDRAGGSLGSGYLVLSLASLVTFAGGVMTRRTQLARAGGEARARQRQLQLKPAVAAVNRAGAGLMRSVGAFGRSAARGTAALGRNVGAHLGFGAPNEAKQHAATLDAKADGSLDAQPPPPPPGTLVEKLPEEPLPPPPGTLVEKLPEEPIEATAEKPVEETADEPVAEATVEEPVAETTVKEPVAETTVEEPVDEATDEKPGEKADEPTEEIATEPARVATLSAVPPKSEPDETAAPDGSDKVTASKPKRRRQRQPAKKVEKKAPAGDGNEPQSPAAPG